MINHNEYLTPDELDNENTLVLYALNQQTRSGDCSEKDSEDTFEQARTNAWRALHGMSQEEAYKQYISLISAIKSAKGWSQKMSLLQSLELDVPGYSESHDISEILSAVRQGNTETLVKLIEERDLDQLNSEGTGALHIAVDEDKEEIVKMLLNGGANVNLKDSWGMTPLHYACELQNTRLIQILLESGGDPSMLTMRVSVLHWSIVK